VVPVRSLRLHPLNLIWVMPAKGSEAHNPNIKKRNHPRR
jgi:hypothetical protein